MPASVVSAPAGLTVAVDTRRVAGVPCLIVPPGLAKQCLALLRSSGWHPAHHSRLVLDRRPGKQATSPRAYQLSDEAAILVTQSLLQDDSVDDLYGPQGAELLQMVRREAIMWRPMFQLHRYIIDEAHCDHGDASSADDPAFIHYHPAHILKRASAGVEPEPEPPLKVEPSAYPQAHPGQRTFSFAELFAGIGGFRVGLEACGGRCVFSSEINPWARTIYALNFAAPPPQQKQEQHPSAEVVAESIQSVDASSVPYHDLMTAGFPCQPFTGTGTGKHDEDNEGEWTEQRPRGFRDPRGQLFWHMIRLIRWHRGEPQRQPKAILLENVPGLFKNDCTAPFTDNDQSESSARAEAGAGDVDSSVLASSALPTVLAALTECGYHVTWKQYDACKLVPQSRLRIYIVAIRNDLVNTAAASATGDDSTASSGGTRIAHLFCWPELPETNPTIGSILHGGPGENNRISANSCDRGGRMDNVDLEKYRLTPNQWARVRDRIERGSGNYLFNTRVADPAGVSNTIRASYRSGYKMYSQFVPMVDRAPTQPVHGVDTAAAPIVIDSDAVATSPATIETTNDHLAGISSAAGSSSKRAESIQQQQQQQQQQPEQETENNEKMVSKPPPAQIPFRFFTPRECARLQGFPDSYLLTGAAEDEGDSRVPQHNAAGGEPTIGHEMVGDKEQTDARERHVVRVPEGAQYSAVGNAVAPPMIEAIVRALLGTLMQ